MTEQLGIPADIKQILEYLAMMAKGYNKNLKWNEIAKLKSDMMRRMDRWRLVAPVQIKDKCLSLGMTEVDTALIVDMLKERLQGRVLVPQQGYRNFEFGQHPLKESCSSIYRQRRHCR